MRAILDSGPIITLWNQEQGRLEWAKDLFRRFSGPYYVTELMLAEVAYLTGRHRDIVTALRSKRFLLEHTILEQLDDVESYLDKFPHCDLADASILALSERHRRLAILTNDRRHFVTYRRHDGSAPELELPPD